MDICITHIFHNCFVLDIGKSSYVFDIPSERFRSKRAVAALEKAVKGRDVFVLFTHSHTDHFAPDFMKVCSMAASLNVVVSDDIEEMYPEVSFDYALVVEPDEKYVFEGLEIETLMSNDLGVAFFFTTPEGVRVYNGGDLACWDWETSSANERKFTRNFFENVINHLGHKQVQVAFSNVDRRLDSLAGGPRFVEVVQPEVFVPTHALGRTEWLSGIHEKLGIEMEKCFVYRRPGDTESFKIGV